VIGASDRAILDGVVRRLARSLLQYVADSFPWTNAGEGPALAQLGTIIREEHEAIAGLGHFLLRYQVGPPYLGQYPADYTTINYISLDHLLALVADDEGKLIVWLERQLNTVSDAEARDQLSRVLEMKRRYLATLQSLSAAHPDSVPVG
jgi:hypothetical protein